MSINSQLSPETMEEIKKTRDNLHKARHLPGYFYTSDEIFQLEMDKILMREWLCVGRVEEYEKNGDYQAFRIANEPVVVCRGQDGQGEQPCLCTTGFPPSCREPYI